MNGKQASRWRILLGLLIAFAGCLDASFAAEQQEAPAESRAEGLLESGQAAVEGAPDNPLSYLFRAVGWREKGELDKALTDCNEAVRLGPKEFGTYAYRGRIWGDKGEWDKAAADFSEAIRLRPNYEELLVLRAWAWTMQREADKAMADANEAVRFAPKNSGTYRARAFVWLLKNDFDRARADLDKVLEIAPERKEVYAVRAAAWQVQGEDEKARADYARAGKPFADMARSSPGSDDAKVARKPVAPRDLSPEARLRMQRGMITISRETTYATAPVGKDGYVDLLAALNEECGRGVTPENNAAVLIWQALGPPSLPRGTAERFYQLLGVPQPVPQEKKDYFVSPGDYAKAHPQPAARGKQHKPDDAVYVLQNWATRPWSKAEFPVAAECLEANKTALDKVVEASRRPRYYSPLVTADTCLPVINSCANDIQAFREPARTLAARAMLRVQEGKSEEAWQDVLAIHRLSRLLGQGPTLDHQLAGTAIGMWASSSTTAVAHYGHPSRATAQRWTADLAELPPLPKASDPMRRGERYNFLDATHEISRHGCRGLFNVLSTVNEASGIAQSPARRASSTFPFWVYNASVDWDEVLRRGNAWYDRLAAAFGEPTRAARDKAIGEIVADFAEIKLGAKTTIGFMPCLTLGLVPPKLTSRQMSDFLLRLMTPSFQAARIPAERNGVYLAFGRISLALAAYRTDHRQYPDKLADLAPQYMPRVPGDPFSGGEVHYKREGEGYLLYSVGSNGKDDGGRDFNANPPGDDLVLRMPTANP
jgi:tetratricopeptide (TPR) repeat protein